MGVIVTSRQKILGHVLRQQRKSAGLSAKELANSIGLSQSTWSRIEDGSINLSVFRLREAALRLGIKPSSLLKKAEDRAVELASEGVEIRDQPLAPSDVDRDLFVAASDKNG